MEKNLLLLEQILSFNSKPYLRKEAMRNLQKLFPLPVWWKGAVLFHIRMISLGDGHIQLLKNICFNKILDLATPLVTIERGHVL